MFCLQKPNTQSHHQSTANNNCLYLISVVLFHAELRYFVGELAMQEMECQNFEGSIFRSCLSKPLNNW